MKSFIVALCIISLVLVSCSGSQASSNSTPDGYLATDSTSVSFMQFTERNSKLSGHINGIEETNTIPLGTKSYTYAFTGTHQGSSITLTFSVLWVQSSITGTFQGDTIKLDLPQTNGYMKEELLKAASIQQYNQAVDTLQKKVSQQDQQYYDAQNAAYNAQATATAVQTEQDAGSNGNYYLSNALSELKKDGDSLSTFSESNTLGAYARDWQQMQNDYTKEQNEVVSLLTV